MIEVKICNNCKREKPIVNKRYGLCDNCNYLRLNGKTKQEVYKERQSRNKAIRQRDNRSFQEKYGRGVRNDGSANNTSRNSGVNRSSKGATVKKISSQNKYRCSDGSYVTQSQINQRYANCIEKIKEEREPICQGSGVRDFPLSFSHTISRKRCKEIGKSDLVYDPDNIEVEGYHEPTSNPIAAHNIWETGTWHQKVKLLNWNRKISYILYNDPEQYKIIEQKLVELGLEDYLA